MQNCSSNLCLKIRRVHLFSNQLMVLEQFPSLFTREEGLDLGKEINLEEIKKFLQNFAKDKSLGLDGWTVELFLAFFDILGKDLLEVA